MNFDTAQIFAAYTKRILVESTEPSDSPQSSPRKGVTMKQKIRVNQAVDQLGKLIPLFDTIIRKVPVKFTYDLDTMAVDNKDNLYINPDFLDELSDKGVLAVFAHEMYHVFHNHPGMMVAHGYNPQIFNWATDYTINRDLLKDGIDINKITAQEHPGFQGIVPIKKGNKYYVKTKNQDGNDTEIDVTNMSAYELYRKLLQVVKDQQQMQGQDQGQGPGQGQDQGQGQGQGQQSDLPVDPSHGKSWDVHEVPENITVVDDIQPDKEEDKEKTPSNKPTSNSKSQQGNQSPETSRGFDVDRADYKPGATDLPSRNAPLPSAEKDKNLSDYYREREISDKLNKQKGAFEITGEQNIDWADQMKDLILTDVEYRSVLMPDRRSAAMNRYIRGQEVVKRDYTVTVMVDTSGSIDKTRFTSFMNEVLNIINMIPGNSKLNLILWHTRVYSTPELFGLTGADSDLIEMIPFEQGGTLFSSAVKYYEKHLDELDTTDALIVFTDGEFFRGEDTNPDLLDVVSDTVKIIFALFSPYELDVIESYTHPNISIVPTDL